MIFAPSYYPDFKCTCGACSHSCCIAWEIDIDKATYKKYKKLKGAAGEKIRQSVDGGKEPHFRLSASGRCPHLNAEGLCDIIISHGEDYLCDICREHPRFYNFFYSGGIKRCEAGLGLACESAARLILLGKDYARLIPIEACLGKAKYNKPKGIDILSEREKIYKKLSEAQIPTTVKILNIAKDYGISPDKLSREESHSIYTSLEYLNEESRVVFLEASEKAPSLTEDKSRMVERYFASLIYRYLPKSTDIRDLSLNVALCAMLALLFAKMADSRESLSDIISCAVRISEEMEYNTDNIERMKIYLDMYARL